MRIAAINTNQQKQQNFGALRPLSPEVKKVLANKVFFSDHVGAQKFADIFTQAKKNQEGNKFLDAALELGDEIKEGEHKGRPTFDLILFEKDKQEKLYIYSVLNSEIYGAEGNLHANSLISKWFGKALDYLENNTKTRAALDGLDKA